VNSAAPESAQQGGFTLVELLLAVALMSILLGLAYGGLRAATLATARGQVALEATGNLRSSHSFIRRQLNQMLPLPFDVVSDADQTRVVFLGDSRRIQFVAPMPGYLGQGGPQVQLIEFMPADDGDGDDLVFTHALLHQFQPEDLSVREPVVLLENVIDGKFEFLFRDEEGVTAWTTAWDQVDQLPLAVGVDLVFTSSERQVWPLLTAGARIDESFAQVQQGRSAYEDAIQNLIKRDVEDIRR